MKTNAHATAALAGPAGLDATDPVSGFHVTPVRQVGEDCGLLACIESIAHDRNIRIDQASLSWRYPHYRRKGSSDRGRVGVRAALEIMADLGLSSNSETVHGRALAVLAAKIPSGVLICVEDDLGRTRWWRLAAIEADGIRVMQPEAADPSRLVALSWSDLEARHGCALAFDL
jgi:hypothetical protein